MLIVTAITTAFHGAQLCELLLPITKYVRLETTQVTDFTDGEVAFGRDGGK